MILFPRLFSRGPIEARVASWSRRTTAAFPRLFSRGPIEAAKELDEVAKKLTGFPRLFSRGPIEARSEIAVLLARMQVSATLQSRPH